MNVFSRLWRLRHLFAGLCIGLAVLLAVQIYTDINQPGRLQVVTAREVLAGTDLTAADLRLQRVPSALLPAAGFTAVTQAVGKSPAVGLPAGVILDAAMLSGSGQLARMPAGFQATAVTLASDGSASLAPVGARIDLLAPAAPAMGVDVASDDSTVDAGQGNIAPAVVLARGAIVLATPTPVSAGLLGASNTALPVIQVALPPGTLEAVVGANARSPLTVGAY